VVVCNSASLRAAFLELGLAAPSKVIVLGNGSSNGVDTVRFHPVAPADEATERLRQRLGFGVEDAVIGFVGRLTGDKGVGDLVAAFDRVLESFPRARLLLVGGPEAGDPLPAGVARRIETDERIVVTGFVEDTAPYYHLMDVLAFASYREGFPNVPLEAAASAVPVVAYRATGTVDAVADGETGLLVEPGNVRGLANAIGALLADRALAEKLSAKARQRAVALYDARKVWQTWAGFYWDNLVERVPALP
jgi:glycosyltransferase involved in cell wall biosynthesis